MSTNGPFQANVITTSPITWRTSSGLLKKEAPQVIRLGGINTQGPLVLGTTLATATSLMNAPYSALTISRIIGMYANEQSKTSAADGILTIVDLNSGWRMDIHEAAGSAFNPIMANCETLVDGVNIAAFCTRAGTLWNFSFYNFEIPTHIPS